MKIIKTYDIPSEDQLGSWFQIDRLFINERKRPKWRLTFENAVGGTIAYRFDSKQEAEFFAQFLTTVKPSLRRFSGATVMFNEIKGN